MSGPGEYALPLFSLIDGTKVDLKQPVPEELAEQLGLYMEGQFGIKSLSSTVVVLQDTPYLVLHGVEADSLPALCSLVDVQRTQLYRYERLDQERVTLIPLNVKI
ncbi:MAG: hypothetical protein ACO3ZW_03850 [Opitutales bacterium]|jgi:hypothetical protein